MELMGSRIDGRFSDVFCTRRLGRYASSMLTRGRWYWGVVRMTNDMEIPVGSATGSEVIDLVDLGVRMKVLP